MKFVKRISLFFIYPLTMFSAGFAANMAIMEFFYPGDAGQTTVKEQEEEKSAESAAPVLLSEEPIVTANTSYIVQDYNSLTGELNEKEQNAPDKFIGLSRDKLAREVEDYNRNPSLTDLEQGFTYMELVSFSPKRVVVRKSFEPTALEQGFFLLNENHYVVVYDEKLTDVYMKTDILVEKLPDKLQNEILHMKYIEDEKGLYNFLESYSS